MSALNLLSIRQKYGFAQQDNNFSDRFIMQGGLIIETPDAPGNAGALIYCRNFEPNFEGGYISKGGYEPIDGRRQPSAFYYAAYKVAAIIGPAANKPGAPFVPISDGINTKAFLGFETINGQLYLIASAVLQSLITADYRQVGAGAVFDTVSFGPGATISSGAGNFATLATGLDYVTSLDNAGLVSRYVTLARTYALSLITKVGNANGKGRALGAFDLNGQMYGIRNNIVGHAADIWKTTDAGWVLVPRTTIVFFSNLNTEVVEGDVITNNAATISFTVGRVIIQFGTTGTGDACGYFATTAVTGGVLPNAQNLKRAGTVIAVTPAGGTVQSTISLPEDGTSAPAAPCTYRFRRWNFSGKPASVVGGGSRIYFVTGQSTAFEFDGTLLIPILTGLGLTSTAFNIVQPTQEKPTHIAIQADHCFLGYVGGGLQHSGYQTPLNWTAVQGADTRQVGDDLTNMLENVNGTLLVQTRTRTGQISGDVNENFQLKWNDADTGAYTFTAQKLAGCAVFLTDQGVMVQSASDDFGNFEALSQSAQVNSLLRALMRSGVGIIDTTLNRERSMYRMYFDNGRVLSFCMIGDKCVGVGYCEYAITPHGFNSGPSTVPTGGANAPPERIYFCGDDGFIYQDDVGGSFAGVLISGRVQTQFYRGQDGQEKMKRYRAMHVDVLGADAYTNLTFSAEYDDGAGYRTSELPETVIANLTGGKYELYSAYNQAYYGPENKNVIRKGLNGQGVGVSFIFTYQSVISLPFTVQAIEFEAALRSRRGWR